MLNNVIFFSRSNCNVSKKILNFLKTKFKKVSYLESDRLGKNDKRKTYKKSLGP